MTLSKKAVRPHQIQFLLDKGILPVSFDYRLCPEINLIDGPITDVRDALLWAQQELPIIASSQDYIIDPESVGNNAASRQQRLSDPLFQSYKRTLLEYIHSQENP